MLTYVRASKALHFKPGADGLLHQVHDWDDEMYDIYGLSTDVLNNLLPTDVANATSFFIMDWEKLPSDIKTQLVSQLYMFDAENKEWLPI